MHFILLDGEGSASSDARFTLDSVHLKPPIVEIRLGLSRR